MQYKKCEGERAALEEKNRALEKKIENLQKDNGKMGGGHARRHLEL